MILHGLSGRDDSGLTATRRAAGGAIDTPVRRRDAQPERWMGWCWRCFWVAIVGAALCAIALG